MEKINIRNIIKLISIILVIMFFVPTFMVSCSGQNINISAAQVMSGVSVQSFGEKQQISEPSPVLILLLLIPVAIVEKALTIFMY